MITLLGLVLAYFASTPLPSLMSFLTAGTVIMKLKMWREEGARWRHLDFSWFFYFPNKQAIDMEFEIKSMSPACGWKNLFSGWLCRVALIEQIIIIHHLVIYYILLNYVGIHYHMVYIINIILYILQKIFIYFVHTLYWLNRYYYADPTSRCPSFIYFLFVWWKTILCRRRTRGSLTIWNIM